MILVTSYVKWTNSQFPFELDIDEWFCPFESLKSLRRSGIGTVLVSLLVITFCSVAADGQRQNWHNPIQYISITNFRFIKQEFCYLLFCQWYLPVCMPEPAPYAFVGCLLVHTKHKFSILIYHPFIFSFITSCKNLQLNLMHIRRSSCTALTNQWSKLLLADSK